MIIKPRVKERTVLFTESCGLECRYCYIKNAESFGKNAPLSKERIFAELDRYIAEDEKSDTITQLLITGGEPFLFPSLIEDIVNKYQNRFWYKFNTSGYLLTPQMLKFLSNYHTSFCLSVDGDEALTNYLRPLKTNEYHIGYMKKFKEIVPTLLYYFPTTTFKMIVGPRYVDKVYETFLFAEQLGFKYFNFILDFESRPSNPIKGKMTWQDKHTKVLEEQMVKIVNEIILGWEQGFIRTQVVNINEVIHFILNKTKFDIDDLPCQLFNGRTNISVGNQKESNCMRKHFSTLEECKKELLSQYNEANGSCERNKGCLAAEFCWHNCCPKESLDAYGKFGLFEDLECIANKESFYSGLYLLSKANFLCRDNPLYGQYLKSMSER